MDYNKSYGNIFIDIFSFVNKIFTVEDFMLRKIPDELKKYLYISSNIDIEGRYLNFNNNNNLNIYIIKTEESFENFYSDIIMFYDIPTLVIIIPSYLTPDKNMINKRSGMIEFIYKNIFNYLTDTIGLYNGSSLGYMLSYSPIVLPILTERQLNFEINIDFYTKYNTEVMKDIMNEVLKHSIDDLFRYGALTAIIKEIKANV